VAEAQSQTGGAVREANARSTVLVIDDEQPFHDIIARYLVGYRVIDAYNGRQGIAALIQHHVDVVLLDLNLPDTQGIVLLGQIRADFADVEVIVITSHTEFKNAIDAVKGGAFDFVAKTYESYQTIGELLIRALNHRRHRRRELAAAAGQAWMGEAFAVLERSTSPEMRAVMRLARQVAATPLTALIEGESGVGKEILARYLHAHSDRSSGSFVPVNMAAVPVSLLESHLFGHVKGAFTGADRTHVGKFEQADGGTLFLDEIGELDAAAQAKLLRVLQEREVERIGAREAAPVDVRVIAATNKNLEREVREGRFREDLYYRLNVVRLPIPPLRARRGDIAPLVTHLVAKQAALLRRDPPIFSLDALTVLAEYDWPGNVRELENLIMRLGAINPGKEIVLDDIPTEYTLEALPRKSAELMAGRLTGGESGLYFLAREQFERYLVRLMVRHCGGDKRRAAQRLGVSHSTVKAKLSGSAGDDDPADE
jgi:DNA-binding NtrC family response regulator